MADMYENSNKNAEKRNNENISESGRKNEEQSNNVGRQDKKEDNK